ncbi:hypothetical protein Cgig2_017925 [Carnegiea gigantea]|uniref:t-SNARE coiled-coil homology domain-containing protein n=1 Tax=Carnegiea gigantea TaxID=171969 RepID=A0A9Q1JHN9_9CARY|nr:hypothetical protein Cgig2_017925 [Carnegiea gigantea]
MASTSGDSWTKEYNEAAKLADDINSTITEKTHMSGVGSESQRHFSAIRRKITILGTRLDNLEDLLAKLPSKHPITEKEMNRRKDLLSNLRSKANSMASTLNMSNFANRDSLLGPEIKPVDAMTRTAGLDNQAEQDEGLEKLEETVISTKHIALTVNEELSLHARLIDSLDDHVEFTGSRMQVAAFTKHLLLKFRAGAEGVSKAEQENQGWMLLPVPGAVSCWNCDSNPCRLCVDKVFMIIGTTTCV